MSGPRHELREFIEALRRARRRATADEWRELCALHDAATRTASFYSSGGIAVFEGPVPSLKALEIEFKPIEPEPVEPEEAEPVRSSTRSPWELPPADKKRLEEGGREPHRDRGAVAKGIAKRYRISRRQVDSLVEGD